MVTNGIMQSNTRSVKNLHTLKYIALTVDLCHHKAKPCEDEGLLLMSASQHLVIIFLRP